MHIRNMLCIYYNERNGEKIGFVLVQHLSDTSPPSLSLRGTQCRSNLQECSGITTPSAGNDLPHPDKGKKQVDKQPRGIRYHQEVECVTMIPKLKLS